ncbi:Nucleoporin nup85 [Coemansia erecta]|uniref:Nuclear pore complex protein Nup85 n=1 Tax=Coemansia asiatica TaxID=1052880 RepID=A0A9W8CIV8_9FUNG|nr:Nucleoporin nup85 [Coemansia asiatica]KAJ2856777.1 Nucleoporin nup85 [Coemansia erecta]
MQTRSKPDKFVVSRDKEATTHLFPGLFPVGRQAEWSKQNRTLTFSIHPLNSKLALAVAGKLPREKLERDTKVYEQDQRVTICGLAAVPDERLPFISDTHAVFVALQRLVEDPADSADRSAVGIEGILRMSTLYREAMLRQVRVLQEVTNTNEFIEEEIEAFQSMHAIWHLFEIIYLATVAPGLSTSVVPYFMEWLNTNFPAPSAEEGRRIAEAFSTADELVKRDGLWPYLKKLAIRGHVSILANMLEKLAPAKLLSPAAARWATAVSETSRKMPLGSSEETTGSFNARWKRWNEEVKNTATSIGCLLNKDKKSDDDDLALESLFAIAEILRGNVDTISAESELWQDVLGAVMLYSEPTAQAGRLPSLASIIVEQYESSAFTELDRALVALLNHDLPEFLPLCSHIDHWLSAHIADLMEHISIMDICRRVFAVNPREHYILALCETYLGHENLWRIGLDYLGLCKTRSGISVMEEFVMRIPLDSDRKAEQVLRVCNQYGLKNAYDRIHRQLGRQKWQRGRLGAAIDHFAKVADNSSISLICDQLWNEYLGSGKLNFGSVIDGVLAAGLKHDRVQFLSRYRDFHECYRSAEFVQAGKTLLSILVSEIAPPHAVADLLIDSIPLLEGDTLVFSSDDTFELMRCAESLTMSQPSSRISNSSVSIRASSQNGIDRSELSIFNVACSRNLARAFVMS